MTEPRHRIVDSQGLAIHCLEWGEPVGEPIVLVHGFLDQAHSWKFFVDELAKRSRQPLWSSRRTAGATVIAAGWVPAAIIISRITSMILIA